MDEWLYGWDRWVNEWCAVQMCDGKMSGCVAASVGGMAGTTGVEFDCKQFKIWA